MVNLNDDDNENRGGKKMAIREFSRESVGVRLRIEDKAELEEMADRTGRPVSQFIREAVREWLEEGEVNGKGNANKKTASTVNEHR